MERKQKNDERPSAYEHFVKRYPKLEQAWNVMREAEAESGPLDERTRRLVKLAIALGSEAEGASHSAVRKAVAAGVTREEIEQVAALVASTIGLPNAVKAYRWIQDVVG